MCPCTSVFVLSEGYDSRQLTKNGKTCQLNRWTLNMRERRKSIKVNKQKDLSGLCVCTKQHSGYGFRNDVFVTALKAISKWVPIDLKGHAIKQNIGGDFIRSPNELIAFNKHSIILAYFYLCGVFDKTTLVLPVSMCNMLLNQKHNYPKQFRFPKCCFLFYFRFDI